MNLASSVVLALVLLASTAHAALKNEGEIDAFVNAAITQLGQGNGGEAFDLLTKQWTAAVKTELETMRKEVVDAGKVNTSRYGALKGTEKVKTCRVGKFLYKSQAVVKYERGFVFWNFTFYNPGDGWALESYRFDNKNFVPLTDACVFQ